jgi:hypothetical protein
MATHGRLPELSAVRNQRFGVRMTRRIAAAIPCLMLALGGVAAMTNSGYASADPSGCQVGTGFMGGVTWCDGPLRADGSWIRCSIQGDLYIRGAGFSPAKRVCYVKGDPNAAPPAIWNADMGAPPEHMAVEPGVPG